MMWSYLGLPAPGQDHGAGEKLPFLGGNLASSDCGCGVSGALGTSTRVTQAGHAWARGRELHVLSLTHAPSLCSDRSK